MIQCIRGNTKKSNILLGILVIAFFIILVYLIFEITTHESFNDTDVLQPSIIDIEEHYNTPIFHFQGSKTCSQCHTNAIIVECITCHPNPPQYINNNTYFPHHDPLGYPQTYSHDDNLPCSLCHDVHGGSDFPDCSSSKCHDAGNDVRYIQVIEGNSEYCNQCHGGESTSHSIHTTINNRGPETPLICGDCHDTNNYPNFNDGQNLSGTTICNTCHSNNGRYDGVDNVSIGAKPYWPNGVYNGTLNPGMEQWCVGCHDNDPSVVDGQTAYDVGLFWSSLKVLSGTVDCESCHYTDIGTHINTSSNDPDLKDSYVNDTYWSTNPLTDLALCFGCHDSDIYVNGSSGSNFFSHGDHVNNFRASCYACHESHGETGEYHMIRVLPVTGPVLDYIHYPNGGNCQAGIEDACHGGDWEDYDY